MRSGTLKLGPRGVIDASVLNTHFVLNTQFAKGVTATQLSPGMHLRAESIVIDGKYRIEKH